MKCDNCNSEDQVVRTQLGNFCREHYKFFKRGKAQGEVHQTVRCSNCGEYTASSRRCIRCGNTLTSTGEVMRIGGHENC